MRTIVLASIVIAATACSTSPPAPATERAPQLTRGTSVLVDVATDATDPHDLSDTEPSIAVNPRDPNEIAIVTFSEPWKEGEPAPVWRSRDGGSTWVKERVLPRVQQGFSGPADQHIAFSPGGRLYIVAMGEEDQTRELLNRIGRPVAHQPSFALGGGFGRDQPQLTAAGDTGRCAAHVFAAWLGVRGGRTASMVSRSSDAGVTIHDSIAGDPPPNRTTRLAVGSDDVAYVVYKIERGAIDSTFQKARFVVRRTDDCGQSWAGAVSVHGPADVVTYYTLRFGNAAKGKTTRARSSDAWIAVAPDGAVYVAFVNRDNSGKGQIFVARSADQGATWSTSRVTDGRHNSAFPEIAVAANGAVGVLFVDYDDSGAKTIFRHRFARSFDKGSNWKHELLQSMEPSAIETAVDGFIWGDFEGLTAVGDTFYGVFTGVSIGRTTLQLDPIFFRQTALPPVAPTDR